jgi:tetratricopeptide (TPR) repeat protein
MQATAQRSDAKRIDPGEAKAAIQKLTADIAAHAANGAANTEALWRRAQIYAEVGNLTGALADLNQLLAAKPKDYQALVKRGDCRMTNADVVGAFKDYADAIQSDPQRPDAYFARGLSLAEQYEYRDAISNFDRAIALAPNDAKVYRARARAQRARASKAVADGEVEQVSVNANSQFGSSFDPKIMALAIDDFSRAIELDDNLRTRIDRAATLDSAERWEEALQDYRYVIERTRAVAASDPRSEAAALLRLAAEGEKDMLAYLGENLPVIPARPAAAKPADLDSFKAALDQTLKPAAPNSVKSSAQPKAADASKASGSKASNAAKIRAEQAEKPEKPQAAAVVDTSSVPINEVRIAAPAPDKSPRTSATDRLTAKRYARLIVAHVREGPLDFIKVRQPYKHLNLKFYAAARAELEASQFKHIVNVEPLHLTRPLGIKTFWSVMVSPSGRTVAIICESYEEPTSALARLKANVFGALPNRIAAIELLSEYSDNTYVMTNNLGPAQVFDPPASANQLAMEPNVDVNRIVGMHRSRMDDYLSEHPGVQSSVVRSWKDFTAIVDRLRLQKLAHRRTVGGGVSDGELARLCKTDYPRLAELIREELSTLLAVR